MDEHFHLFDTDVTGIEPPRLFTCPFHYVPHELSRRAAAQVQRYVATRHDWAAELDKGKMLGVLVVRDNDAGRVGFLAAFSGNLAGSVRHDYFVPPVYDLLDPQGEFKQEERRITDINHRLEQLARSPELQKARWRLQTAQLQMQIKVERYRAIMAQHKKWRDELREFEDFDAEKAEVLRNESRYEKAELKRLRKRHEQVIAGAAAILEEQENVITALKRQRKQMSEALQQRIFRLFVVTNARGERRDLVEVFAPLGTLPPAGAGECCAPRLLNYAFNHHLQPLCMAEFWWGASPVGEVRHHGHYYPACRSKCKPILEFMLQGLEVEPNTLAIAPPPAPLDIIHDDQWLTVVNKPAGLQSVPGKLLEDSLLVRYSQAFPDAHGPIVVHRLDQETSGLIVLAKDKATHQHMQQQFTAHTIVKKYIALLDGEVATDEGVIDLPLLPDVDDRPRQRVDTTRGKRAVTRYRVLQRGDGVTRVCFEPLTGRTHQLRVHAAHPLGLNCPIVSDRLYGTAASRLMLHASSITLQHPATGETMTFTCPPPFLPADE